MKEIWTVFQFTLRDAVRKKAFVATTILVLAVIVAACFLVGIFGGGEDAGTAEPAPEDKTDVCYYVDEAALIPGGLDALASVQPSVDFRAGRTAEMDAYKAQVEEDKHTSIVLVTQEEGLPLLTFYSTDFMSGLSSSRMAEALRSAYVSHVLTQAGVSQEVMRTAMSDLPYREEIVGKMDISGYAVGILMTMILFFAVYYYGYGVAMSVASEKTSRVMETLVVSAKPSQLLFGKCLAMGLLGLIQLLLFLVVGAVSFRLFIPADFTILGMPLALSSFTLSSALLVLLYFLLGYALYAMLNSVCGATVSRAEDLNSAMMPVMLLSLVSFYAAFASIFASSGGMLKRLVTYIPLTSPFALPFRLLNESVPAADIAISLGLLAVSIVLVAMVSVRLYSASVLHYGQRLKLKDALKLKT